MIRLYSQRNSLREFVIADYDPDSRTLLVINGHIGMAKQGQKVDWHGKGEPWDDVGIVIAEYTDGTEAQTRPIPALWSREPRPGYGDIPSEDEQYVTNLLASIGLT